MISAFIPNYNQHDYIERAIKSIYEQDVNFNKILVIDDGSNNKKNLDFLKNYEQVILLKNDKNMGRGFCRNLAITELTDPFILMLDASNFLPRGFTKLGLSHFKCDQVCAVSGLINNDPNQNGFCKNWRSRHLFKEEFDFGTEFHNAKSLTTYGTILRKDSIIKVGNFNKVLRHSEDKDLGKRLLNAGYKIIGDPNLIVYSMKNDSVLSLLARYWRWYGGEDEAMSFIDYWNAIKSSIRPMIQQDLKARDWRAVLVSILCPHYGYARYIYRKITGKLQKTH